MKNIIGFCFIVGIIILSGSSCRKFVEVPLPTDQLQTKEVFADSTDATAAMLGVYQQIGSYYVRTFINSPVTIATGLASDELVPSSVRSADDISVYENSISSQSPQIGVLWNGVYQLIYQTNAVIEGVQASKTVTLNVKNQLLGEAKLARAMMYFHLLNLFGNVPLVNTTNFLVNKSLPRTPADQLYQSMIADLTSAETLLPITYVGSGRLRPNKFAASALLARVYLYQKQWANAETEATKVINSGTYSLEPDLNQVFLAGSNESIWQIYPSVPQVETYEGFLFVPTSQAFIPNYYINKYLLNAFEPGDQRFSKWLNSNTVNGVTYYYPFKYKLGIDGSTTPVEDIMVFRLGEQYLIRAEARAQIGSDFGGAATDLNMIRNRASLPNTTASGQADLLTAIMHERQIELFCENGHRWYDLKRTGQINAVMPAVTAFKGGTWNTNWQLFPIPFSQMNTNPFLVQNPGY
jgi:hypothetical protein